MDIETEVETLRDIYGDMVNYEENKLKCRIEEEVENELDILKGCIDIIFTISEGYPDVLPTFELDSEDVFIINEFERIEGELTEIIETEFSCIFELVDKLKEIISEIINNEIERRREEALEKEREEERRLEAEFEGNTRRTFDEWWAEKEKVKKSILARIEKEKEQEINRKKGRITGKQFFLNKSHSGQGIETDQTIEKTLEEQGVDLDAFGDDLNLDDI